jgi:hypothetical protein
MIWDISSYLICYFAGYYIALLQDISSLFCGIFHRSFVGYDITVDINLIVLWDMTSQFVQILLYCGIFHRNLYESCLESVDIAFLQDEVAISANPMGFPVRMGSLEPIILRLCDS